MTSDFAFHRLGAAFAALAAYDKRRASVAAAERHVAHLERLACSLAGENFMNLTRTMVRCASGRGLCCAPALGLVGVADGAGARRASLTAHNPTRR